MSVTPRGLMDCSGVLLSERSEMMLRSSSEGRSRAVVKALATSSSDKSESCILHLAPLPFQPPSWRYDEKASLSSSSNSLPADASIPRFGSGHLIHLVSTMMEVGYDHEAGEGSREFRRSEDRCDRRRSNLPMEDDSAGRDPTSRRVTAARD